MVYERKFTPLLSMFLLLICPVIVHRLFSISNNVNLNHAIDGMGVMFSYCAVAFYSAQENNTKTFVGSRDYNFDCRTSGVL
jgi:hypothetical protein